ncbi:hypothetical protein GC209_17325 [bacterium]|nr:hypothetical protein [bacterium]
MKNALKMTAAVLLAIGTMQIATAALADDHGSRDVTPERHAGHSSSAASSASILEPQDMAGTHDAGDDSGASNDNGGAGDDSGHDSSGSHSDGGSSHSDGGRSHD